MKLSALTPTQRRRALAGVIIVLAVVVAVIVSLLWTRSTPSTDAHTSQSAPQSDDEYTEPQSVPKTITPQSGGPANTGGALETDAEAGAQSEFVLRTLWDAYSDPMRAQATDLSSVLTASALEEFDEQALEWSREGIRSEGAPTLSGARIISTENGEVTVSVCVDSSGVRVFNDAGTALTDENSITRSLTYLHFANQDGAWKLSGFSFPDDPTC